MAKIYSFRRLLDCAWIAVLLSFSAVGSEAQTIPATTADTVRAMPDVALDDVFVAPSAIDIKGWLLLDKDIQTELDGAVHNIYNFKFNQADRQFRSLRRRYPNHPMPYFLLGLSTWWRIMPSNTYDKKYDKIFYAYMDTAITKAESQYRTDSHNYEAAFFLSAAYGFDARLQAERHDWRKATVSSKRALTYLQKSREANGLSPEFVFGEGLFNYYAVWIAEEYPWLRPVLFFFPKGDRNTGLAQLSQVATKGFYTATEARFFRMRILGSVREDNTAAALIEARTLARDFPDNSCFQRTYALNSFAEGEFFECEKVCRDILAKINKGMPGYDGYSGRLAAYFLGYMEHHQFQNPVAAQDLYRRSMVFSESVSQAEGGYYLFAVANLGRLAATARNVTAARNYFQVVLQQAERKSDLYKEARTYLKKHQLTGDTGRPAASTNFALSK